MQYRLLLTSPIIVALLFAPVSAATRVAGEPGLSGYLGLGVSSVRVESNLIAGDTGEDQIDDLTRSPPANSNSSVSPDLSLTYTFDNLATEVFLGNSVEDFIRFDLTTAIGIRQQVSGVGIFEVAALSTPSPTDIWSDPYLTGADRDETERTADGIRLEWGAILDSGLDLRLSLRDNELDDENSGDALVAANLLTLAEQQTLDRNGDINTLTILHRWRRDRGESTALAVNVVEHDLDGDAMSFDGYSLQLTDVRALGPKLRLVSNLFVGWFDHDARNPVFDKTNDKQLSAVAISLFYAEPFGAKGWLVNAIAAYAEEDNAINFYDTRVSFANVGLLYTF